MKPETVGLSSARLARLDEVMQRRYVDGGYLAMVTNDSWTRVVPTDWLLERKAMLPCQPNEVAAP